jgi:hypothetical protein
MGLVVTQRHLCIRRRREIDTKGRRVGRIAERIVFYGDGSIDRSPCLDYWWEIDVCRAFTFTERDEQMRE